MKEYAEKPDDALVELTLLGNEAAFAELVTRHEKAVKGTAFKVTHNPWSAEDAAQDAFVSAWMRLNGLRDRDRFGSWVCAIAKNCARDLVVHYRNTVPDISLNLASEDDLPDLAFAREEEKRDLHDAVGTLTDKIREVIRLHYFEGYSVDEIAAKLSLPAGTVKWRLSEGRKQLRKGYGIMEKEYDENETLLARVMRQVEELKLWRLRENKNGFEEAYRRVYANAEKLEEGQEKQHVLADLWLMGYWWIPGRVCKETREKIKQAALDGHNEDAMQEIVGYEMERNGKEADYLRNVAIPLLEERKFVQALAYAWFWYGVDMIDEKNEEEARSALLRVTEILGPTCVYYACAKATLSQLGQAVKAKREKNRLFSWGATGETLRKIGGKWYIWDQPGTRRGPALNNGDALTWNCSRCDKLILDPAAKPGDTVVSSDGKATWTLLETDRTVKTPAGEFKGCTVTKVTDDYYGLIEAETAFCPGVGLVWQRSVRHGG
ncbi:MAG: RNA polymerase sigma factor, partial [Clostridia bacterium]|nr:RNA polymerase sigma factor [Clostridia bacterium]